MNTTHPVYVDMDGVLVDFTGALLARFGFSFDSIEEGKTIRKGKVWKRIQVYNDTVDPWFYSLPMMEDAKVLWEFITTNFANVEILTASGNTPRDAPGQKKAWMGDHFGYDIKVNVVASASEKKEFATPTSIMIDDSNRRVIQPFIAAGGIGVLHTSAATTIAALTTLMEGWSID